MAANALSEASNRTDMTYLPTNQLQGATMWLKSQFNDDINKIFPK